MAGTTNNDSKLWAAIAAFLGILGLIVMLLKPNDNHVKFYALQSALLSIVAIILSFLYGILAAIFMVMAFFGGGAVLVLLGIISSVVGLAFFIVWLFQIIKAFQGDRWKIPIIGDIVEKNFMK